MYLKDQHTGETWITGSSYHSIYDLPGLRWCLCLLPSYEFFILCGLFVFFFRFLLWLFFLVLISIVFVCPSFVDKSLKYKCCCSSNKKNPHKNPNNNGTCLILYNLVVKIQRRQILTFPNLPLHYVITPFVHSSVKDFGIIACSWIV